MQLTRHTDYALRLLIYLTGVEGGRTSIAEVADSQDVSRTHLMKIANELARNGFIEAVRGRSGGICLGKPAAEINIGQVVRVTERGCGLVDCTGCRLIRRCGLPSVLNEAEQAFFAVLDRFTLADIVRSKKQGAALEFAT